MANTISSVLTSSVSGSTYPTIAITTSFATSNGVRLEFEYLPESVSFGVSATFSQTEIPFTAARFLSYDHSDIEEVSIDVKVVAGCNNAITIFGGTVSSGALGGALNSASLVAGKYERVALVTIAQLLYSLPLPSNNQGTAQGGTPPPTCRLIVGRMFSGVGAFTGASIKFNGPYDYDGSPTDMDVSLRFLPSEFYNSTGFAGIPSDPSGLVSTSSPSGDSELTGTTPYALAFGATVSNVGLPGISAVNPGTPTPPTTPAQPSGQPNQVPSSKVQGPTQPTPTNEQAGAAMGFPANQVYYDLNSDTYYFGPMDPSTGKPTTDPATGKPDTNKYVPYGGDVVRSAVVSQGYSSPR